MKPIRYILLLLFLGLIPFSCGKDVPLHFRIDSMSVTAWKDANFSIPVTANDSLNNILTHFKLRLNVTYLASLPHVSFTNSLYAATKPRQGRDGLNDKLNDISIFSDKQFNGRPAGDNIKDLFRWDNYDSHATTYKVDELKYKLNQSANFINGDRYDAQIVLTSIPTDSLSHRFTFVFHYDNGVNQNTTTDKITWEP